jgi:hypothetical protein
VDTGDSGDGTKVRTEFFVGVIMAAFTDQMEVEIAEEIWERIGIVDFKGVAGVRAALDFVAGGFGSGGLTGGPGGFEEAFWAELDGVSDFGGRVRRILEDQASFGGPGEEEANGPAVRNGVRAKKGKRIGIASGEEDVDLGVETGEALGFR